MPKAKKPPSKSAKSSKPTKPFSKTAGDSIPPNKTSVDHHPSSELRSIASPSIKQCSQDYVWDEMRVLPGDADSKDCFRTTGKLQARNTLCGVKDGQILIMQVPGYPVILSRKQGEQLIQWIRRLNA